MKPVALLRSILLVTASLLAAHVEAKPLLQDLTPVGADRGPSGDGRIPTWNGGLQAGQVSLAI
ncbi:DUF1329 domain-containing protein, partial [Pseudomonas monteilii]|nr:DUF1329 domain-containing protein [Pseudomonas monteilii]